MSMVSVHAMHPALSKIHFGKGYTRQAPYPFLRVGQALVLTLGPSLNVYL